MMMVRDGRFGPCCLCKPYNGQETSKFKCISKDRNFQKLQNLTNRDLLALFVLKLWSNKGNPLGRGCGMLGNCTFLLLMVISQPKKILNKKTT